MTNVQRSVVLAATGVGGALAVGAVASYKYVNGAVDSGLAKITPEGWEGSQTKYVVSHLLTLAVVIVPVVVAACAAATGLTKQLPAPALESAVQSLAAIKEVEERNGVIVSMVKTFTEVGSELAKFVGLESTNHDSVNAALQQVGPAVIKVIAAGDRTGTISFEFPLSDF